MTNTYLLLGLEASPAVFARLLDVIPEGRWDTRSDPDRFTVREVYAHVADWEPVLQARLKGTLERDGFALPNHDPGEWAIDHKYSKSNPHTEVEKFRRARAETVAMIRTLPAGGFKRVGIHPGRGPMSVAEQLTSILGHDMYHIEQVSQQI